MRIYRLTRMPDPEELPKEQIDSVREEIADLVRRALIQTADLQNIEEKLKDISERSSKMTPPPKGDADAPRSK